ncbi:MAG: DegT/DnrJ/EryC1/StrS family aminotransferase [bacterium]|nr:DegT/DnrJ/EryC1/StrS family aminotransferase [bacterium]
MDKQFFPIRKEINKKINEVISSKAFIQGPYVAELEKKFSRLHGCQWAAGCSSGTSALLLSLEASGIQKGDEVITTPLTFIATVEAVCQLGARPVFADIDPDTYVMDTDQIESRISKKTRAIIPVHLFGNPVRMDDITALARKYNLKVIEDCAQAHLSSYNGRPVGSFGDTGAFSFYPGKNLGAYGDAGMVVTNSQDLAARIKKLLDHGRSRKYYHDILGFNHRMDGLQAGILLVKLQYLKEWTKQRQSHARYYNGLLKDVPGIKLPKVQEKGSHVYHLYVIRVKDRPRVMDHLKKKGIQTLIHYPVPLHLQPALGFLGYQKGDFPNAELAAERVLSLPLYPELKRSEIEFICQELHQCV